MSDYNKNLYTGITAMHDSLPITIYGRNYFTLSVNVLLENKVKMIRNKI